MGKVLFLHCLLLPMEKSQRGIGGGFQKFQVFPCNMPVTLGLSFLLKGLLQGKDLKLSEQYISELGSCLG